MSRFGKCDPCSPIGPGTLLLHPNNLKALTAYRICCDWNDLYLPNELWKIIAWWISEIKVIPPDSSTILEWIDSYCSDPELQHTNPILLAKQNPVGVMYLLSHQTPPVDFSYEVLSVDVCHTGMGRCNCNIPFYGDMLIGIVVQPAISAVNVEVANWLMNIGCTFSYASEDLQLHKLTNVYTHTMDEILENHQTTLFQPKFSTGSIMVWGIPKITPFFISKARVKLTLDFLITSHINKIELVYLFMNPDVIDDSIHLAPYKGMLYEDGCFFPKSWKIDNASQNDY
jgi:hypothetical protein